MAFRSKRAVSGRQCSYQSDPCSQKDEDRGNWGDVEELFERLHFPPPEKKGGITCYRPFLMLLIAQISRPKMKVGCSCCFSHCSAKHL